MRVFAGVWLRMENGFSGKEFPLTVKLRPLTRENIFSQNFTFKSFPETRKERKRERKDSRANIERERSRAQKVEIVAPPARSSTRDRRTHERQTHERRTHEPTNRKSHCYRSRSCDFDFLLSPFDLWFFCCCCGGVGGGVLVVFLLCGGGFCVGGGGK